MGTPKKPVKKKVVSKNTGAKKSEDESTDPKAKKRFVDDEDEDDEFGMPLDDLGYENLDYDDEDDYDHEFHYDGRPLASLAGALSFRKRAKHANENWRTRRDSNPWPLPSEGSALSS